MIAGINKHKEAKSFFRFQAGIKQLFIFPVCFPDPSFYPVSLGSFFKISFRNTNQNLRRISTFQFRIQPDYSEGIPLENIAFADKLLYLIFAAKMLFFSECLHGMDYPGKRQGSGFLYFTFWDFKINCSIAMVIEGAVLVGAFMLSVSPASVTALAVVETQGGDQGAVLLEIRKIIEQGFDTGRAEKMSMSYFLISSAVKSLSMVL